MLEALTHSVVARAAVLATALSWSQPLGCHQLSGLNVGPYHLEGQDPALGTRIPEAQLTVDVTVAALASRRLRFYGCDAVLERAVRIAKSFPEELRPEVALGAWISSDAASNERQLSCLSRVCGDGLCDLAIVGTEALLRSDVSEATLLAYLARTKQALPNVPVTTADVYGVLLDHPAVLSAVDVVMANIYPFWDGIRIDRAVRHLHERYLELKTAAGDRDVVVAETGWPSCGRAVGEAVPNGINAAFYLHHAVTWSRVEGVTMYWFALFDEPWKAQHEGALGRCWGLLESDYTAKAGIDAVFDDERPGPADGW